MQQDAEELELKTVAGEKSLLLSCLSLNHQNPNSMLWTTMFLHIVNPSEQVWWATCASLAGLFLCGSMLGSVRCISRKTLRVSCLELEQR